MLQGGSRPGSQRFLQAALSDANQPSAVPDTSHQSAPTDASLQAAAADHHLEGDDVAVLQQALSLSLSNDSTAADAAAESSSAAATSAMDHSASARVPSSQQDQESADQAAQVEVLVHELVDRAIRLVLDKGKMPAAQWDPQLLDCHPEGSSSLQPGFASQQAQLEAHQSPRSAPDSSLTDDSAGPSGDTSLQAGSVRPQHRGASWDHLQGASGNPSGDHTWAMVGMPQEQSRKSEQRARELAEAEVLSNFLTASSSQLTTHGLLSLQQVGISVKQTSTFILHHLSCQGYCRHKTGL